MPKPQKRENKRHNIQGERTRQLLLKSAGLLFAKKGYDGVSIRCISDEMDIMPSLIIHHFGSKENLYLKTLEHHVLNSGYFQRAIIPLVLADNSDSQSQADALGDFIHLIFEAWHGPNRSKTLNNLLQQLISGKGPISTRDVANWLIPMEKPLRDFLRRIKPAWNDTRIRIRVDIIWANLFYPGTVREFIMAENGWKDYPPEWLACWEQEIVRDLTLALGLPEARRRAI